MTLEERNAAGFANAIVLDEDEDEGEDEDEDEDALELVADGAAAEEEMLQNNPIEACEAPSHPFP